MLSGQISRRPPRPCACVGRHGGSGRYVFLGPDGGHRRRGRYAQRLFRPACDGRYASQKGLPGKTVIVDASTWPGLPVAAWPSGHPPADPSTRPTAGFTPPRGRGIRCIAEKVPVACWLPVKQGLTPHGLRHSHKTWMEDGISGILQERRLGHEVPGMRGLYTHVSQAMRAEFTGALQSRWEDSLRVRAAIALPRPAA